jgi:DnaJ homologue, subfamily C, member 28, conserved domain
MPFSRVAERRIREAVEQGEFENLPGAGKPLNLEEYFSTPEDLRMAFSLLKNANCAPAEVELLKEVSRLEHAIAETSDAVTKRELQRTLAHRQTELAIALERRSPRER